MRFPENITDDTNLFVDGKDHHSTIQQHTLRIPYSIDKKTSSSPEQCIYNIEEKRLLKRASWSPSGIQECGLPPTGKRTDGNYLSVNKNSNRVPMRSKHHQISLKRPVSFNERFVSCF
jgi:hypothetical protein